LPQPKAAMEATDPWEQGQVGAVNSFVVVDAVATHLHQIIGITGHEVAFDDLRALENGTFELVEVVFLLACQRDAHEDGGAATERLVVETGPVSGDDARVLQRSHPAQARRSRQVHALG